MSLPSEIETGLAEIRNARNIGYNKALPGALDDKFIAVARFFAKATAEERTELIESIAADTRLLIIGFSDRLATLAARSGEIEYLFLALLAHLIEDFRHDARENILRLALIHHVARKLKEDESSLFEKALSIASERALPHLKEFIGRSPEMKSLKTMRIKEIETDEGVGYQYGY